MPRSVTVALRSGVDQVALPDHRLAKPGHNYTIRLEDFQRISRSHLESMFSVVTVNTTPKALHGVDLTLNSATLSLVSGGNTWRVGRVEKGTGENDRFMLVKAVDINLAAGDAVCWASKKARTVTKDRVGGSAANPLEFAGIALATVTAGRYGWIMVDGWCNVPTSVGTAGDPLAVHPTTDGVLEVYELNAIWTFTTGAASAGTVDITVNGQTALGLAYAANAATVQTALRALSGVGSTGVTVTGTNLTTPGLTFTFAGLLADKAVTVSGTAHGLTDGGVTATQTVRGHAPEGAIGTSLGAEGVDIRGSRRLSLANSRFVKG